MGIGYAARGSDGDRRGAAHRAVAEAVLGAAGLARDDLEDEPGASWSGDGPASSPDGLSRAVRAVEGENYQVVNVDLTLVGDARGRGGAGDDGLRERLADRLHVSPGHVSVGDGRPLPPEPGADAGGWGVMAVALLDRMPPMDQTHSTLRAGG